jgi:hypothetical protein
MASWRKLILKTLLASLALAGAAGALAVLLAGDVIWRVMITGFLTAGAALFMLPLSHMVDRRATSSAGLAGITTVVAVFVLCLMLTWGLHAALPGRWGAEELWLTIAMIVPTGTAAMVFLWMLELPPGRIAGHAGLALAGTVFLAAIAATWMPPFNLGAAKWIGVQEKLWCSAGGIAGFGVIGVVALVGAGGGDRRYWRWLGVAAITVALGLALVDLWHRWFWNEDLMAVLVATGCFVAYTNVAVLIPLKKEQRWLRSASIGAAGSTGLLTVLIFAGFDAEPVERLDAATAILTGCGFLAMGVLARLNRRVDFSPLPGELLQITMICPRCRKKQAIPTGGASCKGCGLRIEVRTEEPSCAQCGYLLYKLTSDRCPECGAAVQTPAAKDAA